MSVRSVLFASVCTALLAAPAAVIGVTAAAASSLAQTEEAYKSLKAGDFANAISGYTVAIEARDLPPENLANALLNRAYAYQHEGETEKAIDDYTAALRIDALNAQTRATALYNRGLGYQKLNRPALAIEDFTGSLYLNAEFSHAYYSRGQSLRDSGQFLFALSDYEKARRYNHPQPHLPLYGEALAYRALNRDVQAKDAIVKALAARPDFEPARKLLSDVGGTVPAAGAPEASIDKIVTASVTPLVDNQVVRKAELPKPVSPPEALLNPQPNVKTAMGETLVSQDGAEVRGKKKFTDRIGPEENIKVERKPIKPRLEDPAKPKLVEPAKKPVETVVAVEPLPDDQAESTSAARSPAGPEQTDSVEESFAKEPKGWSVQLSSETNEQTAWDKWSKLKAKHAVLADQNAMVIKADLGKKGVFYRLRLAGFDNQSSAKGLCSKLKSRGLSCFVSKASS
jgi:tetratricopeptide (TPR) repeat protein